MRERNNSSLPIAFLGDWKNKEGFSRTACRWLANSRLASRVSLTHTYTHTDSLSLPQRVYRGKRANYTLSPSCMRQSASRSSFSQYPSLNGCRRRESGQEAGHVYIVAILLVCPPESTRESLLKLLSRALKYIRVCRSARAFEAKAPRYTVIYFFVTFVEREKEVEVKRSSVQ